MGGSAAEEPKNPSEKVTRTVGFLNHPKPVRETRPFDLEEFRDMGSPGILGKAMKKFNNLSMHKGDKKMKFPQRGLKLVKSSAVVVKPAKGPYG